MDFKIIMLSKRRLEKSIKLIENSFNISKDDLDHPRKFLPASLDPKTKENRGVYDSTGCKEVKYFITIDEKTGKVIGIVGYYTNNFDYKEADWLAWFVVDPNYRRKGIGKKLLEFIIKNARKRGKKFLRLSASTQPTFRQKFPLNWKNVLKTLSGRNVLLR